MINLFDSYHQDSWDLHFSLLKSGYQHPTVVIQDDGFLPEDVTSPYLYFTGFEQAEGHPLYFNDLPLPPFWEIRATNQQGEVFNLHEKKAVIQFSKAHHNRLVKSVEWLDSKERIRLIDRYNRFGYRFAQTLVAESGQHIKTSYYNREGQEVIVENHVTGSILLFDQGQDHLFHSREQFVAYYLEQAGFHLDRIFYNSLSTPFFVALNLHHTGRDILFWQEGISDSIPGNMTFLLQQNHRETEILVQDRESYERALSLLPTEYHSRVSYLGFLYPFKEQASFTKDGLILTNSDQIEQVETLIREIPELHFHIAALTEMSGTLMKLAAYANVSLYPNVTVQKARELLQESTFYLDINHYDEILSAVRAAFEYQTLIFAFDTTAHNRKYLAPELLYSVHATEEMVTTLRQCLVTEKRYSQLLQAQKWQANLSTEADYQAKIG